MKNEYYPVVLVGGSIASISFIRTLREINNTDKVLLVYGEDRLPYKRTKINKNMVRGFEKDEFKIADLAWYHENDVDLINGWVSKINPQEKSIQIGEECTIHYGKLLLATGASSVVPVIEGIESSELHGVQNIFDVERLLEQTKDKNRFLIIGGGVEGIETADQLVRKGKQVTIAGRMIYPMKKLFPYEFIKPLEQAMSQRGVKFYWEVSIKSAHKVNESYQVTIGDQVEEFDCIVACAGAKPNISLAKDAGIKVDKGILVDEWLRTSDPDIMSAGDVAQHANGVVTGLWHAAEHQGRLAALNLLQNVEPHTLPPYRLKTEVFNLFLFSAEYELNMPTDYEVLKEEENGVMRWMYFKDNVLKALLMLNDGERAKEYQQALMEGWTKDKVKKELPIKPPLTFNFSPTF